MFVTLRRSPVVNSLSHIAPFGKHSAPFATLEGRISKFLSSWGNFLAPVLARLEYLGHSIGIGTPDADPTRSVSLPPDLVTARLVSLMNDCEREPSYADLYFDIRHINEELVLYGMKGYVGHFVFQLATLLFGIIVKHRVCSSVIRVLETSLQMRAGMGVGSTVSFSQLQRDNCRLFLLRWIQQLSYFLSHFPRQYRGTRPLWRLEKESITLEQQANSLIDSL